MNNANYCIKMAVTATNFCALKACHEFNLDTLILVSMASTAERLSHLEDLFCF